MSVPPLRTIFASKPLGMASAPLHTARAAVDTQQGVVAGALDAIHAARAVPYPPRHDWNSLQSKPGKKSRLQNESFVDAIAGSLHKIFGEIKFSFADGIKGTRVDGPNYLGMVSINGVELRTVGTPKTDGYGDWWKIELHGDYVTQGMRHSILVTDDVSFGFAAIAQKQVKGVDQLQAMNR